jgi:hypothetical protein
MPPGERPFRARAPALTVVSALLCLPSSARAQPPIPEASGPPPIEDRAAVEERHWRAPQGAEVTFHAGAAGFSETSSAAFTAMSATSEHRFAPGPSGRLSMGWRLLPWLSLGGMVMYQYIPTPDRPPGVISAHSDMVTAGLYARFYPGPLLRWKRFDPWISGGINPAALVWFEPHTMTITLVELSTGIALPVALGLDVRVSPSFTVGAMAELSRWIISARCVAGPQGGMLCNNANVGDNTHLFVGLGIRYTLLD